MVLPARRASWRWRVATTREPLVALAYVGLFGVGSIIGMAVLSLAVSWPLSLAARGAWWLHRGLTVAMAVIAMGIGVDVMIETGGTAWTIF